MLYLTFPSHWVSCLCKRERKARHLLKWQFKSHALSTNKSFIYLLTTLKATNWPPPPSRRSCDTEIQREREREKKWTWFLLEAEQISNGNKDTPSTRQLEWINDKCEMCRQIIWEQKQRGKKKNEKNLRLQKQILKEIISVIHQIIRNLFWLELGKG